MVLMPSSFRSSLLKKWLGSWLKWGRPERLRKNRDRHFAAMSAEVQHLEDRVLLSAPTVTSGSSNLAANATSVVIAGTNFDPIVANNSVTFNDGAAGTVTAATSTSLTVTFSTKPTAAGSLTAVV